MSASAAIFRILTSPRVYWGLVVNGFASLGSFVISISVARSVGGMELGEFAIAFSVYALLTGATRAVVAEPQLAGVADTSDLRRSAGRVSLMALICALPVAAFGLLLSSPYLLTIGIASHGLALYDYSRTMNVAAFSKTMAAVQELCWFAGSLLAGVLSWFGLISGSCAFIVWACVGAFIGYVATVVQRMVLRPSWNANRVRTSTALAFGGDYIIGVGSAQLAFGLVGATGGLPVVGALRAAATLLGPVTMVLSSARSLLIPYLSRSVKGGKDDRAHAAIASSAIIACVTLPVLAVVAFLPDVVGGALLGANWAVAKSVLPLLALESAFSALATIPFAGLRALLAGRASLFVRIALAAVRLTAVPMAAFSLGLPGAAAALAAVSAAGAVTWWSCYLIVLMRKEPEA